MAVLYRSNQQSIMLQAELARCGIAFKVFGSTKFTESKHIKDVPAALKWAENTSEAILSTAIAASGKALREPSDVPGARIAVLQGPLGAACEIIKMETPPDA